MTPASDGLTPFARRMRCAVVNGCHVKVGGDGRRILAVGHGSFPVGRWFLVNGGRLFA